jgi:purine nucleosidase
VPLHRVPGDHRGREARRRRRRRPLNLVLDTDIGSDVDDALALAYALRHPEIELRAVTTVSADTTARARIAARLLAIDGRDDVIVAAGVGGNSDRTWFGHEGVGLPAGPEVALDARHAVDVLLDLSREPDPPVVATVGMQSNVAAAVTRDPEYPPRVPQLAVMGGIFRPFDRYGIRLEAGDHNLVCDPESSATALNAGFRILYVPLDVTFRVALRTTHLDRLRAGDALCRALAELCDVWRPVMQTRTNGPIPDDVVAVLHDPLTVACVVTRRFVTVETLPVRVVAIDGVPRTVVDAERGRPAEVVTDVDVDEFVEHWCDVLIG